MTARLSPRLSVCLALLGLACLPLAVRAQSDGVGSPTGAWDISDLLDHLPTMSPFGKLNENSAFPIKYYARPHLGDFFHRDYLRLPVGARAQITDHVELNTEVEGYFTHGLRDTAGYGLSRFRIGGKYEEVMSTLHPLGWSTGLDFETPLSRPPMELTDGHRHLLPFLAFSKVILPDSKVVGYTGFHFDFLSHTPLPANFGRNQLHSNSTTFGAGLTLRYALEHPVRVIGQVFTNSLSGVLPTRGTPEAREAQAADIEARGQAALEYMDHYPRPAPA